MGSDVKIDGEYAVVTVDTKIYPIQAIYSAAYVFLSNTYILLDGDPDKEIIVKIKRKDGLKDNMSLEELGFSFANEMITFTDFLIRSRESKKICEMLLQKALFTNDPKVFKKKESFDKDKLNYLLKELKKNDADWDDLEQIAVPWEEKNGKKDSPKT